jgi:hypothetical protein
MGARMSNEWIKHEPWAFPETAPRENQTILALIYFKDAPGIEVLNYDEDTKKHVIWWMPIPRFPENIKCDFDI